MDSVTVPQNFLQILDDAVNHNLEKAAEKRGIPVQELFIVFQESGWQKNVTNKVQLETISRKCDTAKVHENKVDTECTQECLVCAS